MDEWRVDFFESGEFIIPLPFGFGAVCIRIGDKKERERERETRLDYVAN